MTDAFVWLFFQFYIFLISTLSPETGK